MPTATHTVVAHAHTSLLPLTSKGKMTLQHARTLRSGYPNRPGLLDGGLAAGLYSRAARAFLQRDIPLAHSLLDAAFALLGPPAGASPLPALQAQRKKWDILRITLETTVHAAPSPSLPDALREFAALPSAAAVDAMYKRSLALFTPISAVGAGADAAFLPSQILATLAYSSLKLGCADAGRAMIEEWLARRRVDEEGGRRLDDGYAQIIEVYVLQVLPALGEWEYATEFLAYEQELSDAARQFPLDCFYAHRSPARSHCQWPVRDDARPNTAELVSKLDSLAPPTDATTTGAAPRPLEVLRAYLSQYFGSSRTSYSTWTFAVLFVLVPLISFVLRRRRRARIVGAGSAAAGTVAAAGTADLVRRRLRDDSSGLLARAWGGVARAVGDTVRMAGSGLV
ncbi:hypothetical protein K525DRAFT_251114 [Schizophyllum commune Loenen D]|nr:hypothetical protein K525DRAFT_251114 [Schizophyllum commune Loenen D]